MCWTSILVKQHTKYTIILLFKKSYMFWYNTSSEVTKGKKKKREREGMVLISCSTNPHKHLASYPERKKKKKPWVTQLSALMLFIVSDHLILCASKEWLMLDFPFLKVLKNNKMAHFTKFNMQYVIYIRDRHPCLDYRSVFLQKSVGF